MKVEVVSMILPRTPYYNLSTTERKEVLDWYSSQSSSSFETTPLERSEDIESSRRNSVSITTIFWRLFWIKNLRGISLKIYLPPKKKLEQANSKLNLSRNKIEKTHSFNHYQIFTREWNCRIHQRRARSLSLSPPRNRAPQK
jgi:hypothetical protein